MLFSKNVFASANITCNNGFSLSGDVARSRDQWSMWLYGWQPIKVSYHPAKFDHRHSGSRIIMNLICRVIFEDPLDQRVMWLYRWGSLMIRHHLAKFGSHRHRGSGDIMFLVAKGENLRCSRFNCYCCLFLNNMGWKHTLCNIINSDPGHTHSK